VEVLLVVVGGGWGGGYYNKLRFATVCCVRGGVFRGIESPSCTDICAKILNV